MRHISLLCIALVSSSFVMACSGGPDESAFHRTATKPDAKSKSGGSAPSPAGSPEDTTHQTQTPTAGTDNSKPPPNATPAPAPAAPATPLKASVCENPTCGPNQQQQDTYTCYAKDTQGTPVQMDCQGGVCTCFTGNEGTTQFDDLNAKSDADFRSLYFANCQCL
jgi:hypothetical protein